MMLLLSKSSHQNGDSLNTDTKQNLLSENIKLAVETYGGRVHVEWDPQAAVTPLGQLAFFIEYLKLGGLFDSWVSDCGLSYASPNSPDKRSVLGTLMLSILAGHNRYAHITTIRCDGINPELLGMKKLISEDSMRRALKQVSVLDGSEEWMRKHLGKCYEPLLEEAWILDIDTTVKVLYGRQEGAVVGYNPKKPGRPSHTYHSYFMSNLRLLLDVEVHSGKEIGSKHSASGLWRLIKSLPEKKRPHFIRGDCGFGNDAIMQEAEENDVKYLFKLKQSKNVKSLIEKLMFTSGWEDAGQGWQGLGSSIQLMGWKKYRRVIILRRKISKHSLVEVKKNTKSEQLEFKFGTLANQDYTYEYGVLVTSLPDGILTLAQHYRDRADCENVFDELKNQWGWSGFTTRDIGRCKLVARIIGLVYNWWTLFVRLANPDSHLEAITSRPLLLHSVGKQSSHGGQTFITISSTHGEINKVQKLLNRIVVFFKELKSNTEQLTSEQRWYRILSRSVEKFLNGRQLHPPIYLTI